MSAKFKETYKALPVSVLGRTVTIGDKIIMPASALAKMQNLNHDMTGGTVLCLSKVREIDEKASKVERARRRRQKDIYRKRLNKIYHVADPRKCGQKVDALLEKYGDDLHNLYLRICTKYEWENVEAPWPPSDSNMEKHGNYMEQKYHRGVTFHYCSIKEFSSPESDCIYMEQWMMDNLKLEPGNRVVATIKSNILPGTFCEFVSLQPGFLALIDQIGPKFLLEHTMKNYSVLFKNERILIPYEGDEYELFVNRTEPEKCISLFDCDLEVTVVPADPDMDVSQIVNSKIDHEKDVEISMMSLEEQDQLASDLRGELEAEDAKAKPKVGEERDAPEEKEEEVEGLSEKPQESGNSDSPLEPKEDEQLCPHCLKCIPKMSFMMHEMRCGRLLQNCSLCGVRVPKSGFAEHMAAFHDDVTCACGEILEGTNQLKIHQETDCIFRVIECKYCFQKFKKVEFDDHVSRCGQEEMTCPDCDDTYLRKDAHCHECTRLCGCGQRIPLRMVMIHKLTDCPKRKALCQYCKLPRLVSTWYDHVEYCGSKTEQCPICEKYVSLKHLADHVRSNCTLFSATQVKEAQEAERTMAQFRESDLLAQFRQEEFRQPSPEPPAAEVPVSCPSCGKLVGGSSMLQLHQQFECVAANVPSYAAPTVSSSARHDAHLRALPAWTCPDCTFHNPSGATSCQMCSRLNPSWP